MDFRSEGPFPGVSQTLVGEDHQQEGERWERRLQGGHEGISDIGESKSYVLLNTLSCQLFIFQPVVLLSDGNIAVGLYDAGLLPTRDFGINKVCPSNTMRMKNDSEDL